VLGALRSTANGPAKTPSGSREGIAPASKTADIPAANDDDTPVPTGEAPSAAVGKNALAGATADPAHLGGATQPPRAKGAPTRARTWSDPDERPTPSRTRRLSLPSFTDADQLNRDEVKAKLLQLNQQKPEAVAQSRGWERLRKMGARQINAKLEKDGSPTAGQALKPAVVKGAAEKPPSPSPRADAGATPPPPDRLNPPKKQGELATVGANQGDRASQSTPKGEDVTQEPMLTGKVVTVRNLAEACYYVSETGEAPSKRKMKKVKKKKMHTLKHIHKKGFKLRILSEQPSQEGLVEVKRVDGEKFPIIADKPQGKTKKGKTPKTQNLAETVWVHYKDYLVLEGPND